MATRCPVARISRILACVTIAAAQPAPRPPRRVDVDDVAFRVISAGPSAASAALPPTVLVHGIGASHRYLSRLHATLAVDGAVHSIDLPGYAGLPKPGRDLPVEAMAHGLTAVIAGLGLGPVVLVGHSMGAQWVVEAAAQRPDLVTDVVIMGPVADAAHRTLPAQLSALALDTLGESPTVNGIVFTDYLRCGVPWYLAQVRHMLSYPIEERVAALDVPLLVLRGARDPIAGREWCRALRDAAASATLVEIPRGFHVVQHTAPRAVASAIWALTGRAQVTA